MFGVRVGLKNYYGLYGYRLTTFDLQILRFSCSSISFEFVVSGGLGDDVF